MANTKPQDNLDIPPFLKRKASDKASAKSEVAMSETAGVVKAPQKATDKATPKGAKVATPKPAKATPQAPKPQSKLIERDGYGFKAGTLRSKAAAMYGSKEGATIEEVKKATGGLQLNLLKTLEKQGWKVRREKGDGPTGRKVNRYFLSK